MIKHACVAKWFSAIAGCKLDGSEAGSYARLPKRSTREEDFGLTFSSSFSAVRSTV